MHIQRKTKIVATIGPTSEIPEVFTKLLRAGVNVTRSNMSHGDHEEHLKRIKAIRAVSKKENIPVALLLDLAGPKIRIGDFEGGDVELVPGQEFVLSGKSCIGDSTRVFFNYPKIIKDINPGQIFMLDDGKKKLVVTKIVDGDIYTKVVIGGKTKSRRGVNLPGAYLSISAITNKDKIDLAFGIEQNVDFVALSFVRTAKDIDELRGIITKKGGKQMIIAKIETEEAIINIDEIIAKTDGIMVARGDLAVEIGPEKVPPIQKMIIRKCNALGKPVIVATQMMESMITSPVPTRAEVSDVANAIFDGADAVMLSEETALGQYPVETVTTMHYVALNVEEDIGTHRRFKVQLDNAVDSICSSVVHVAEDVKSKAIIVFTDSGKTARLMARYRPQQPILTATPFDYVARQTLLSYGCYPIVVKKFKTLEDASDFMNIFLKKEKLVQKNDTIVISAGMPFKKVAIGTNALAVVTIK